MDTSFKKAVFATWILVLHCTVLHITAAVKILSSDGACKAKTDIGKINLSPLAGTGGKARYAFNWTCYSVSLNALFWNSLTKSADDSTKVFIEYFWEFQPNIAQEMLLT